MKRCTVTIGTGENKGDFPGDTLLVDALARLGVLISTPCGGKGRCKKCRIHVDGEVSDCTAIEKELGLEGTGYRLACQTLCKGDVRVTIDAPAVSTKPEVLMPDPASDYAAAVDIGTTSVKISMVDIKGIKAFPIDAFINPQRRYGDDVISRISASRDPAAHKEMVGKIRENVFNSLARFCETSSISPDRIVSMICSGNTVMLSLFFGLDISDMGRYPFQAPSLDFENFDSLSREAGIFSHLQFSAIPALSSFIGGDLMGGLVYMFDQGFKKNIYFIDMGTNGEIFVINSSGEIYAASCAMGPALEGMNISNGMTAGPGAITRVWIDRGRLAYGMIGTGHPKGLTGTALIDCISILLNKGVITSTGSISKDEKIQVPAPGAIIAGSTREVMLWQGISVSQQDIRNVQMAKGASLAASSILLDEAGIAVEDIEDVLIAGAFGEHLNLDSFKRLRFIPEFGQASIHFVGNSSLRAAETICRDIGIRDQVRDFRDSTREVELSMNPSFNSLFIDSLNFPEGDSGE